MSNIAFPSSDRIAEFLCSHPALAAYNRALIDAVAKLAAERFGRSSFSFGGIYLGTWAIFYDLKKEKDGFTKELLPKMSELLMGINIKEIRKATAQALYECRSK